MSSIEVSPKEDESREVDVTNGGVGGGSRGLLLAVAGGVSRRLSLVGVDAKRRGRVRFLLLTTNHKSKRMRYHNTTHLYAEIVQQTTHQTLALTQKIQTEAMPCCERHKAKKTKMQIFEIFKSIFRNYVIPHILNIPFIYCILHYKIFNIKFKNKFS